LKIDVFLTDFGWCIEKEI